MFLFVSFKVVKIILGFSTVLYLSTALGFVENADLAKTLEPICRFPVLKQVKQ